MLFLHRENMLSSPQLWDCLSGWLELRIINLLIVCLSIAGHTTQGYTGSGMLCTTYLALGVPLGNR